MSEPGPTVAVDVGVVAHGGDVVVSFGRGPLLNMTPDNARALARALDAKALEAEAQLEGRGPDAEAPRG